MKEKRLVPKRRFEGFQNTDAWEWRKLSELMKFSNGINAPKESYGKGRKMISVLDILADRAIIYEDILNSVYVDPKVENNNKVENGDLVFVRSSETQDEVGWTKAYRQDNYALFSGFSIRGKSINKFDAKFIELSLNYANRKQIERKAGGSTRYNVSQSILNDVVIFTASIEEQIRIRNFFDELEKTIASHQRKLEKTKALKSAYLAEMFPAEGERVPKRRFSEFTGEWEERKFFDNIRRTIDFRGRTPKKLGLDWNDTGYLALSALNVKNGYIDFNTDGHYGNRELYDKWMTGSELKKGQVLFTTEAPMGNVAQVPDNRGYILSQRTISFDVEPEKITNDFLASLLRSDKTFKVLSNLSSGGTAKGVSQRSLEQLKVFVPKKLKEQQAIGKFFKKLDESITNQQQKLAKLKAMKQAYLQEMFV